MRRLLLAPLLCLPLVGAYCPGTNLTANHQLSAQAAGSLGAKFCRVEFASTTPTSAMDADVGALTDRGCHPVLLAGISLTPTQTDVTAQLGNWAARYGPGGTFWAGRTEVAATSIELGNETSYRNDAPDGPGAGDDWWASSTYINRARNYGLRAQQAAGAVGQANSGVGVMVQGDSGGSLSPSWVDNMYTGCGCQLHEVADGFTVHPYGPQSRWQPKIDRLVQDLANHGAGGEWIDVTEYGVATDDGRTLSDNYGWPVNLTYGQAAAALEQGVGGIRAHLGDRLRYMLLYQAMDNQPHGATTNREAYFGGLQSNLAEKGAFSTEVRDQLDE